jgi:hypothetical protein
MKQFLKHRSRKHGYDGWAFRVKGAKEPMAWSVCTTREELRDLKKTEGAWLRPDIKIVKVKIRVEVVA